MPPKANDHSGLAMSLVEHLIQQHQQRRQPFFDKLWRYYRNALSPTSLSDNLARPYRLDQEAGLPQRFRPAENDTAPAADRERVIENDIAWRVNTLVEFMFGKPVTILSTVHDTKRAEQIEAFLRDVFDANGAVQFFQNMSLLGSVYGHVDILARVNTKHIELDLIDATRGVALTDPNDYRRLRAYLVHVDQQTDALESTGFVERLRNRFSSSDTAPTHRRQEQHTLVWTAEQFQQYRGRRGWFQGHLQPVTQELNRCGRIPVVHIQNLPLPFSYEGLSDVEPLIPLQDELNTRLSDRANRVTFQSFQMFLGKGIENFVDKPIGPGQMWQTDNLDASIEQFGGGGLDPSETAHIQEIREALDKISGVTPVAAGLIRDRVGNLTSENALRITLMGLLAKINKKRLTYGKGIEQLCDLVLHLADLHGLFPNTPEERGVRLNWPDPLPQNERQQLENASLKLQLGVPQRTVLAELGYDETALT